MFVYSAGSNGNVAPIATISGSNTDLEHPVGITLDRGNIYVSDEGDDGPGDDAPGDGTQRVFIYAAARSSTRGEINEAPIATIGGSNTGLIYPLDVAVDSSGKIYVADDGDDSSGDVRRGCRSMRRGAAATSPPFATISGSNTGLIGPHRHCGGLRRQDLCGGSRTYDGSRTLLRGPRHVFVLGGEQRQRHAHRHHRREQHWPANGPVAIALDSSGNMYVVNYGPANSVVVYPAGSSGNVARFRP